MDAKEEALCGARVAGPGVTVCSEIRSTALNLEDVHYGNCTQHAIGICRRSRGLFESVPYLVACGGVFGGIPHTLSGPRK